MVEIDVTPALRALLEPRLSIATALDAVPNAPGLYAVHASADTWIELGLEPSAGDGPLYVGKAEDSLVNRDLKTHFATGRTGQSTLRRSFAALLSSNLDLHGVPRNKAKPDGSAHFGLQPDADARLTEWMQTNLKLAVWPGHDGVVLETVETAVLSAWQPPLNLMKVARPWNICGTREPAWLPRHETGLHRRRPSLPHTTSR